MKRSKKVWRQLLSVALAAMILGGQADGIQICAMEMVQEKTEAAGSQDTEENKSETEDKSDVDVENVDITQETDKKESADKTNTGTAENNQDKDLEESGTSGEESKAVSTDKDNPENLEESMDEDGSLSKDSDKAEVKDKADPKEIDKEEEKAEEIQEMDIQYDTLETEYTYTQEFHEEKRLGNTSIIIEAPIGVLPDEAEARVKVLNASSTQKAVKKAITEELEEGKQDNEEIEVVGMNIYDISIWIDDQEIQPDQEKGEVSVTFQDISIKTEKDTSDEVSYLKVFHVDDDKKSAEEMTTDIDTEREELSFDTKHFSIYAIAAVGGSISYSNGASGTFTLPAGTYTMEVKGAGGAAAYDTCFLPGGNGGYAAGTFQFDKQTTFSFVTGTGGRCNPGQNASQSGSDGTPGGGMGYLRPGGYGAASGGGGGYSAIKVKDTYLVIAGGGGGGDTSSDHTGVAGGAGGSGGGQSGMNGANGGYAHPDKGVYIAVGGGGGGYRGGNVHTGGTSYVSSEAINSNMLPGCGASGGRSNGASGSGGSIKVTWNQCSHAIDSVSYEALGDNQNHKVVCDACGNTVSEKVACMDYDEDGLCDDCKQIVAPYFKNNEEKEIKIQYASEGNTVLEVKPEMTEGFQGTLQWYQKKDGVETLLEKEQTATLMIKNEELAAGTYQYYCVLSYEGKATGTRASAVQTIQVSRAPAYLQLDTTDIQCEYGTQKQEINYRITADASYQTSLYKGQEHGGELQCTSSDESVVEVYSEKKENNTGIIRLEINNAGTAIISCLVTEGKNYKASQEQIIQVNVDKTGVTEFCFLQIPRTIKYRDASAFISYAYKGISENADGVIRVFAENVRQEDGRAVLEPVIQEDGKTIALRTWNTGTAKVILQVDEEGRNYRFPKDSGFPSNVIKTQEIEVIKADGKIQIDKKMMEKDILTIHKNYSKTESENQCKVSYHYNANEDDNIYGIGQVSVKTEEGMLVKAELKDKELLILTPLKAGRTNLELCASEGKNYTECSESFAVEVINCITQDGLIWDFDFNEDGSISIKGVHTEDGSPMDKVITVPDSFVINGEEKVVVSIKKDTFPEDCGVESVVIPETVTTIEDDAIDKNIHIITSPGSSAEEYAKEHDNPLTIQSANASYDVVKQNDRWVAVNYVPADYDKLATLVIPERIDGYPIVDIAKEAVTSNTTLIIINSPDFVLQETDLENVSDKIKVQMPNDAFVLIRENDKFGITDYLVTNKKGTITVPEQIMGFPVVSVHKNLADKTTECLIIRGEETMIPEHTAWHTDMTMVVVKDSQADTFAKEHHFQTILYLALGGIEVNLTADVNAPVGNKLATEKVKITGYWDRERTKSGNITWEQLTTIPADITIRQLGKNKFIIGYYDAFTYFMVNGYAMEKESSSKNHSSHKVQIPAKKTEIHSVEDLERHFQNLTDNVEQSTIDSLIDTGTIYLSKDVVDSLYQDGFSRLNQDAQNTLIKSELSHLEPEQVQNAMEHLKKGEQVEFLKQDEMSSITEETFSRQKDDTKNRRIQDKVMRGTLFLLPILLLILAGYLICRKMSKKEEKTV